jgi:hypothetical protein
METTEESEEGMSELKPCPLCGSSDLSLRDYGIECRNCGLWLGDGTRLQEVLGALPEAWNSRAESAELSAALAAVKRRDEVIARIIKDCGDPLEQARCQQWAAEQLKEAK